MKRPADCAFTPIAAKNAKAPKKFVFCKGSLLAIMAVPIETSWHPSLRPPLQPLNDQDI